MNNVVMNKFLVFLGWTSVAFALGAAFPYFFPSVNDWIDINWFPQLGLPPAPPATTIELVRGGLSAVILIPIFYYLREKPPLILYSIFYLFLIGPSHWIRFWKFDWQDFTLTTVCFLVLYCICLLAKRSLEKLREHKDLEAHQ